MNNETELSLSDLMQKAFRLSFKLLYPDGDTGKAPEQEFGTVDEDDMVFAWADGLMHRYYERISGGQCSLQASIDFDVEQFEKDIKRDISIMEKLLLDRAANAC